MRHHCERCGNQWFEREERYLEELTEWIHYADDLDADYRAALTRLHAKLTRALFALEHAETSARNYEAIADYWKRVASVPF